MDDNYRQLLELWADWKEAKTIEEKEIVIDQIELFKSQVEWTQRMDDLIRNGIIKGDSR